MQKNYSYFLKIFFFVLVFSLGVTLNSEAKKTRTKKKVAPNCRAAILSNSTQSKRLFGKNVTTPVPPASTTKVMTAILVLENLPLDKYLRVSSRATMVSPSKMNAHAGEYYQVKDLLYALLISSSNDAGVVLAEAVAGNEYSFVKMMNSRAKQIGAKNTKFANAHGLPAKGVNQYTTAYDMYLIFREALKFPFFREAIKYKYKTIYSQDGRKIALRNHNKMLFMGWKKHVFGKTGYTRAAQGCFVGTFNKGEDTVIVGVFGCQERWDYIKNIVEKYAGVDL